MSSHNLSERQIFKETLSFQISAGWDTPVRNEPADYTALPNPFEMAQFSPKGSLGEAGQAPSPAIPVTTMGSADAVSEAEKLAASCDTLEALASVIQAFDGLNLKKTATNVVFADGLAGAPLMLIGEAPGADEDIQGKPFVGQSGQLLDKILASIDLSRKAGDVQKSVYITNIVNWRPPGNRTPSDSEIAISRPFILRHIQLAKPQIVLLAGGVAARALLDGSQSLSRLRGRFHDLNDGQGRTIPTLVTYHPAYLLRTPLQKKAVWQDMLQLQEFLRLRSI